LSLPELRHSVNEADLYRLQTIERLQEKEGRGL